MKQYEVNFKCTNEEYVTVDANSEEDAIEQIENEWSSNGDVYIFGVQEVGGDDE